ncbi:MAG: purine-nucleoside phosphorylase [Dissulfurimicrobium sp.]|uniref:purine-nucleoside phosphorylase n=1 Tax=Dissulfurimicrobium TaxID=1769732 RepID=UPI003C782A84
MHETLNTSLTYFKKTLPLIPDVCLVLGTGLGGVVRAMDVTWSKDYKDIPGFPISTSPTHAGKLLVGTINGTKAALFQGRFHYYEGYSAREVAMPVQIMALLGARLLITCNAAGGLNPDLIQGDIMLIKDHINLIPDNPLRGSNIDAAGPRFPDLSCAYPKEIREKVLSLAEGMGIKLKEGVFVAVPGPSLETAAETRFLRMIGADAVAMSLVPEVIAAVHAGMKVIGLSVIANINDPDNFRPILIEDVIEQAHRAEGRLEQLIVNILEEWRNWKK